MSSLSKIFLTGGFALAFGSAAMAADLPRGLPSMPLPPPIQSAPMLVDEFASGWYLRGDLGYRMNDVEEVTNFTGFSPTENELKDSFLVGFGGGYKLQWFRADVTLDYGTKAKYSGRVIPGGAEDFNAKIDSFSVLANVYGDLGTWFGFTPYVGAGAGGAFLRTNDFRSPTFLPLSSEVESRGEWNFSWAWMAGVSYRVSENFQLDLGYRHIKLGDVSTAEDDFGNQLTFKKVSADEFRLGVRYLID